ncbi:hypothetical protein GEV33_009160 [Tenebrio molitor]|uniref:Uncharacterized protein n=1 Tax=Tenebrio molitor TaxID=7067 RepID=A0A8J6HFV4_TENMO|nr:hypothetical protein GEV33_009160 [Tenebrio molitor]
MAHQMHPRVDSVGNRMRFRRRDGWTRGIRSERLESVSRKGPLSRGSPPDRGVEKLGRPPVESQRYKYRDSAVGREVDPNCGRIKD